MTRKGSCSSCCRCRSRSSAARSRSSVHCERDRWEGGSDDSLRAQERAKAAVRQQRNDAAYARSEHLTPAQGEGSRAPPSHFCALCCCSCPLLLSPQARPLRMRSLLLSRMIACVSARRVELLRYSLCFSEATRALPVPAKHSSARSFFSFAAAVFGSLTLRLCHKIDLGMLTLLLCLCGVLLHSLLRDLRFCTVCLHMIALQFALESSSSSASEHRRRPASACPSPRPALTPSLHCRTHPSRLVSALLCFSSRRSLGLHESRCRASDGCNVCCSGIASRHSLDRY